MEIPAERETEREREREEIIIRTWKFLERRGGGEKREKERRRDKWKFLEGVSRNSLRERIGEERGRGDYHSRGNSSRKRVERGAERRGEERRGEKWKFLEEG